MRSARWFVLPVIVVPLAWLFFQGLGRDPRELPSPLIGKPMPAFTLTTIDGRTVTSAQLKGRPVMLNFWASWCIPACVDEHPVLLDAQRRYGDRVQIVGVLYNDTVPDALAFLARYGDGGYLQLRDPAGTLALDFGVTGPPETYFIDAAGIVRAKQFGPLTTATLEAKIASVLNR